MGGTSIKRLALLRHADALPRRPGEEDSDRPLSDRGHSQSATVAKKLAALRFNPDKILLSDAQRARETWGTLAQVNGIEFRPVTDNALYLAPPATLLAFIQSLGEESENLLAIGHNPGITILAQALAGETSDSTALSRLSQGLPTAGFALFELTIEDWTGLMPGAARLASCIAV